MTSSESPRDTALHHAQALRWAFVTIDYDAQDPTLWDGLNLETLLRFSCVPSGRAGARLLPDALEWGRLHADFAPRPDPLAP